MLTAPRTQRAVGAAMSKTRRDWQQSDLFDAAPLIQPTGEKPMKAKSVAAAHPRPVSSILNPAKRYTIAAATDVRALFARERKALGIAPPKRAPQPARTAIERARRQGHPFLIAGGKAL